MAMSAGGLAGALGFGTVGHRLHRRAAFIAAVFGSCTAPLAMATLPPFPVLVALAAVVGVLYGPVGPLVNTAMQIRTPERLSARPSGRRHDLGGLHRGPGRVLDRGPAGGGVWAACAFLAMASTLLAVVLVVMPMRALRELDAAEPCPPAPVPARPGSRASHRARRPPEGT